MPAVKQLIRLTTDQANALIGVPGQFVMELDVNTIRLYDGLTPGGFSLLSKLLADELYAPNSPILTQLASSSAQGLLFVDTADNTLAFRSIRGGDNVTVENGDGETGDIVISAATDTSFNDVVLTGDPTAPTPGITSNNTSIATTEFVRDLGFSFTQFMDNTGAKVLTAADVNTAFVSVAAGDFTLPAASTAGIPIGVGFCICNEFSAAIQVNVAGMDTLDGEVSLELQPGGCVVIMKRSASKWRTTINCNMSSPLFGQVGVTNDLTIGGTAYINAGIEVAGVINSDTAITTIASSATLNLDGVNSNNVNITGTVTITQINLAEGCTRICRFDGSLILTNNSKIKTQNNGNNFITTAGDILQFVGEAGGIVRVAASALANGVALGGGGIATTGDMIGATSVTKAIPPGLLIWHPLVPKCMVSFSVAGAVVSINGSGSYGCTVTRNGLGDFRITLTKWNFGTSKPCVTGTVGTATYPANWHGIVPYNFDIHGLFIDIATIDQGGNAQDPVWCSIVIHGP